MISVFTTISDPTKRGDAWQPALMSYCDLADEVIIVNGGKESLMVDPKIKEYWHEWPKEFNWRLIGEQFCRGYEHATGDWVIHADLDFIFHEKDMDSIVEAFERNPYEPALSFWKYQFVLPDRYNLKSRLVLAVNKKKYGDRIKFNSGGDLCQPSMDGKRFKNIKEARIPFYNYECLTKTKEQIMADKGRFARAWANTFGEQRLGYDDQSAYNEWWEMVKGRLLYKPQETKVDHPVYIQETIRNLKPRHFGYDGFGLRDYV